ncbi:GDSL-like lipase/acylhydrolase [mine drainage metagenome]|uniref:GDSL-like lipase/acylhydrolase n=1 Tax=mine drainage metagenome TaxID=410659 RepID=A0A1J5TW27_9ZZZZ
MHQLKIVSAILISIILAGCGGGGSNSDLPAKPRFTSQVSFGDSLSDVGSYKVGPILAAGGGQFTINAASATPPTLTNWTELTAASLGLGTCAALTGGFGVVPVAHPGCFGYAEGGARVTLQPGVGNTDSTLGPGSGAMTVPVLQQIQNHLAAITGNKFSGSELVLVMAGANDVFTQAAYVAASAVSPASAVAAVQTAAAELANDVKTQIIANGAKYVVVANIPDIGQTPYGVSLGANVALIDTLVSAFNAQLKADLPDSPNVLNVDAFTASGDEVANPAKYNLSNVIAPACNIAALPNNSSLFCTPSTLIPAVDAHYLYADAVHPTPYGYALFATYILQAMTNKGWY